VHRALRAESAPRPNAGFSQAALRQKWDMERGKGKREQEKRKGGRRDGKKPFVK